MSNGYGYNKGWTMSYYSTRSAPVNTLTSMVQLHKLDKPPSRPWKTHAKDCMDQDFNSYPKLPFTQSSGRQQYVMQNRTVQELKYPVVMYILVANQNI